VTNSPPGAPSPASPYPQRLAALRERMKEARCPALLIAAMTNIRYLCGFTGSSGYLLVLKDEAALHTDGRYAIQARRQAPETRVVISQKNVLGAVASHIKKLRLRTVAFEPHRLRFDEYEYLRRELAGRRLKRADPWVELLRAVKSPEEIERLSRAAELNSQAFERACRRVRPNWTEVRLAAEIEYQMRLLGAEGPAFDTIVASGPRSALPHAQPSREKLQRNSLIVVDQGAILDGYTSDMTRMVCLGRAAGRQRELFRAVREAQSAALDAVRAGVQAATVDRKARQALRRRRLDKVFTHSTGHGLGLEIHELPRLGPKERTRLCEGMVVTVEPGAYLEDIGGVRIEDVVVVTRNGCRNLTSAPKGLREL